MDAGAAQEGVGGSGESATVAAPLPVARSVGSPDVAHGLSTAGLTALGGGGDTAASGRARAPGAGSRGVPGVGGRGVPPTSLASRADELVPNGPEVVRTHIEPAWFRTSSGSGLGRISAVRFG